MHLHWERSQNTAGDCNIRSLSWMGRVPDELPTEEGWKLNRNHYYQEGWLSTANLRGVVGVTYTTSHCGMEGSSQLVPPSRTNYNLRGHRAEVTLVKWNEPYQKLASCDTSGIIFVWIKYEGRWSIELINDRNTPVICFSWSHDGRMALICYQDGFVLVGSVAGQRYWSTMIPPDVSGITSGVWTPDDQHVYLGTTQGDILVMDIHGNNVGKSNLRPGVPINEMVWNCERFNMEEPGEHHLGGGLHGADRPGFGANGYQSNVIPPKETKPYQRSDGRSFVMAACLKNGEILLLRSFDDVIPQVLQTGFQNYHVDWTNSGELLAVAGKFREIAVKSNHTIRYLNVLHFYNDIGQMVYKVDIPCETFPVSAITWGHNDKRLFVATGNEIHIGWVSPTIGSLQLLSRLKIHNSLRNEDQVQLLPLPCRLQNLIGMLFTQTIRCCIPDPNELRNFVIKPQLPENTRLHCTMIRHNEKTAKNTTGNGTTSAASLSENSSNNNTTSTSNESEAEKLGQTSAYTLYLEHLGGFLPLLKGKRVSKLRPEFIIYDPQLPQDVETGNCSWHSGVPQLSVHLKRLNQGLQEASGGAASEAETTDEETSSPRGRRRRNRRRTPAGRYGFVSYEPPDYMNILPEDRKLVEVSSNIWGTKFKIIGTHFETLPTYLGQINYKASLLHLQPRQMRLEIIDLKEENLDPFNDEFNGTDLDDLASWIGEDDQRSESDNRSDQNSRDRSRSASRATFLSDDEDNDSKAVTMKDDILTAVTDFNPKPASIAAVPNVAPIAPLPSRLSFCLSPQRQQQLDSMLASGITTTSSSIIEQQQANTVSPQKPTTTTSSVAAVIENDLEDVSEDVIISCSSPTTAKLLSASSGTTTSSTTEPSSTSGGGCNAIGSIVAVKRSPTVAPSVVPRLLAKSAAAAELVTTEVGVLGDGGGLQFVGAVMESPSKRKLRMSVSCDNYLGDGKFSLCRRDSVGSGSPHSSKGSPLRWATKADEIAMTTSMTAASTGSPLKDLAGNSNHQDILESQRSCSANHLDAIVDILGVPSELLSQRDFNKRLFLLKNDKKGHVNKANNGVLRRNLRSKYLKNTKTNTTTSHTNNSGQNNPRAPSIGNIGNKSKSCDIEENSPQENLLVEVKRRSIYAKDCRGRTEAQSCNKCQVVAQEVKDMELNREIFDIDDCEMETNSDKPADNTNNPDIRIAQAEFQEYDADVAESQKNPKNVDAEELIQVLEDHKDSKIELVLEPASSCTTVETFHDPPSLKSKPRRFDSVKNLLEKVRTKLSSTRNFMKSRSRSRNRTQSQGPPDLKKENNAVDICLENKSLLSVPKSKNPDSESGNGSEISQSSPNTPAQIRKEKRYRSFSPVRSFLNSPLIRRRKKSSMDSGTSTTSAANSEKTELSEATDASLTPDIKRRENLNKLLVVDSDSDDNDSGIGTHSSSKEFNYHNLETFQKKKLKQKLKNMNKPNTTSTVPSEGGPSPGVGAEASTGPYPSPPPAPQRVPHPPRKNLQHASGLLQPSTPLLPRRTLKKHNLGLHHPGNTPTSTPNPTPNVRRRGLNALIQQYQQQNQIHTSDIEKKEALLLNKKRRRLILHNKAPMWNDASQVYQLDFGGRVTQESAKNFQIEYRGKQVMQFGRIDHNAYTLDFQYPFSAAQAFAVALANVTQRLK